MSLTSRPNDFEVIFAQIPLSPGCFGNFQVYENAESFAFEACYGASYKHTKFERNRGRIDEGMLEKQFGWGETVDFAKSSPPEPSLVCTRSDVFAACLRC